MRLRSIVKSIVAASVIGAFTLTAGETFAADSIAVVNIQAIMHDSTAAKSVKDQLDAKQKTFQSEVQKKEEEFQKEEQDLGKQRAVLSPDAFDKKLKDFKTRAGAAEKDVHAKRAELDNAFSGALSDIQKSVFEIVSTIAKEKGYTIVMPASALLYADSKLDITQEVLTKLNSSLPKVNVNFKAGSKSKSDE